MKITVAAKLFLFLVVAYTLMPAVLYAAAAEAQVQEMPVGVRQTTSNVLETFTGFIHPSLSLSENYNDNIFASYTGRKQDFDTIFSPGIWISLAGLSEQLYTISTSYV